MVDWVEGLDDADVEERDSGTVLVRVPGSPDVLKEAAVSGFVTKDLSGNVLIGTTTAGASTQRGFVSVVGDASAHIIGHANGVISGNSYEVFSYNGTVIGAITQNGTTGVLYTSASDGRLKHDIVDALEASSLIDAIQVRSFKWNADNSHQAYGFVAQELLEVAPEAVNQPADQEQMMAVDCSKLVPMLVKEIQSLRARLAALENQV